MFVHAQLQSGLRPDAILVPQQAVSRDTSGLALVWVVGEDGIANPRKVQTLRNVGNTWLAGDLPFDLAVLIIWNQSREASVEIVVGLGSVTGERKGGRAIDQESLDARARQEKR